MVNKVILSGPLVSNPEMSYTSQGMAVSRFQLKVKRTGLIASEWRGDLEEREEVSFVPIVAWNDQAEICNAYLRQDMEVSIVGQLAIRSYRGRDNLKRTVVEVVASEIHLLDGTLRSQHVEGEISIEDLEVGYGL